MSTASLREVMGCLEQFAPPGLAESWDRSGLQVGDPDSKVRAVLVSAALEKLLFSEAFLERACREATTGFFRYRRDLLRSRPYHRPTDFERRLMQVKIEDGHFTKIRGDKSNPRSKGYTCEKALRLNHYQNGRHRLTSPMRRTVSA